MDHSRWKTAVVRNPIVIEDRIAELEELIESQEAWVEHVRDDARRQESASGVGIYLDNALERLREAVATLRHLKKELKGLKKQR